MVLKKINRPKNLAKKSPRTVSLVKMISYLIKPNGHQLPAKNDNLAQNPGVSGDKIAGVKNVQKYDMVVEDVNIDSENEEWDTKNPSQLRNLNSDDSSNGEGNAESNNKDKFGTEPVFMP